METVPPEMERSLAAKLVEDSEREKLSDAVSPALSEATSELIEMVGAVVSAIVIESDCHVLRLPHSIERSLAVELLVPRVAIMSTS